MSNRRAMMTVTEIWIVVVGDRGPAVAVAVVAVASAASDDYWRGRWFVFVGC